jgi:UTP--glucose-1-phosphate uridylyltransferase
MGDMVILDSHIGPRLAGPENGSTASSLLVEEYGNSGLPCVGVSPMPVEDLCNYGVVRIQGGEIVEIIEKPAIKDAPSNLVMVGRYILPKETSEILEIYPLSKSKDLQSIHLLSHLIENGGLRAIEFNDMKVYDSGNPISWLKSQIDHALEREDLRYDLANWLTSRLDE